MSQNQSAQGLQAATRRNQPLAGTNAYVRDSLHARCFWSRAFLKHGIQSTLSDVELDEAYILSLQSAVRAFDTDPEMMTVILGISRHMDMGELDEFFSPESKSGESSWRTPPFKAAEPLIQEYRTMHRQRFQDIVAAKEGFKASTSTALAMLSDQADSHGVSEEAAELSRTHAIGDRLWWWQQSYGIKAASIGAWPRYYEARDLVQALVADDPLRFGGLHSIAIPSGSSVNALIPIPDDPHREVNSEITLERSKLADLTIALSALTSARQGRIDLTVLARTDYGRHIITEEVKKLLPHVVLVADRSMN